MYQINIFLIQKKIIQRQDCNYHMIYKNIYINNFRDENLQNYWWRLADSIIIYSTSINNEEILQSSQGSEQKLG